MSELLMVLLVPGDVVKIDCRNSYFRDVQGIKEDKIYVRILEVISPKFAVQTQCFRASSIVHPNKTGIIFFTHEIIEVRH